MIKNISATLVALLMIALFATTSCTKDDDDEPMLPDFTGTYTQQDQMGRPAINTVFVGAAEKDNFNTTIPSEQGATYAAGFEAGLEALSPAYDVDTDANLLGLTASAFAGVLATDVLTVATDKPTTFFDGTNVLTGRALADDVIDVELTLIFGGEDGAETPTLSSDNVSENDKAFLNSFPYLAAPW